MVATVLLANEIEDVQDWESRQALEMPIAVHWAFLVANNGTGLG
jgi:hypothetical protein